MQSFIFFPQIVQTFHQFLSLRTCFLPKSCHQGTSPVLTKQVSYRFFHYYSQLCLCFFYFDLLIFFNIINIFHFVCVYWQFTDSFQLFLDCFSNHVWYHIYSFSQQCFHKSVDIEWWRNFRISGNTAFVFLFNCIYSMIFMLVQLSFLFFLLDFHFDKLTFRRLF